MQKPQKDHNFNKWLSKQSGIKIRLREKYKKLTDSAIYRNILQENGVKIMSAKENITDDYTGVLTTSVIEGLNEFFLLDLSNKVSRNMCLNAEKGQWNGRHASLAVTS